MNSKSYYVILFLLIPVGIFSQNFSVKGKIYDINNSPISYANIILLNQHDATVLTGTSSNDLGVFLLNNIEPNNYIIKVTFIGFTEFTQEIVVDKNIDLASIILNESNQNLDEVSITIKKPTIKKQADRLTFNVDNTALTEGNMLEIVKSTPGVVVVDNKILIKSAAPIVYINDKKVHLTGEELIQLLESSPANSVKSIEVITNPPAKYDASSGAVLSILMEKNLITGYRGSVFTNYTQGVFPRYNLGMTNFYKTDKISVFANYSYTQSKINRESEDKINFLNNGNIFEKWNSNHNRNTWSNTHNFNFNLDYSINDSNSISFSSNLLFLPYYKYLTQGNTVITDNQNTILSTFNSNNISRDQKHNLGFDLNYEHLFKNAAKLSVNTHYTVYDYDRKQNVLSHYFYPTDPASSNAFNTKANQGTDIYTLQVDYFLPINETASFSTGIKSSFIENKSDIKHFDEVGGNPIFNSENSDAFNYFEDVFAAYASYEKKWEKWSLSTGLRVEQTFIKGVSPLTSQEDKQDYLKIFPTFNLSKQLTENIHLYINYKRNLERPNYQDLNPFKYFLNDNTIVVGNPNLQPAYIDKAVIGATINDSYTFEAYYNYADASFLELPIQNNQENQLVYTSVNLKNTIEYGFDFSTYFNMTDNWFIYFVTSVYNVQDQLEQNNELLKKNTWSNYSVLSNDFSFLKDKSMSANFTLIYLGKNQQGFQDVKTRLATDLAIKKTVFNKKGTISLSASGLFNTQNFSVTSKYLNQNNSRFFNQDNRYVKLGFSYKFGNTTLETNERTIQQKERDRLEK